MPCTGSRLRRFGLGWTSPANLHGKEGSSESSPVRASTRHYPWPRSRILVLLSGRFRKKRVPALGGYYGAVRVAGPVRQVSAVRRGRQEGTAGSAGSLFPVCLRDTNVLSELRKVQSGKQVGMLALRIESVGAGLLYLSVTSIVERKDPDHGALLSI